MAAGEQRKLEHLYLVDGSGYIFRAFHALPPMHRPDGTPTNAVFGFTNMILKLLEDSEADGLAVIFDAGATSFRNEIYDDYKAHRPDPPEELIPQFGLIREATRAFGLPCIEMENYEADDLIATFARRAREAGIEVTIVSSDKDLMQLVGPGVTMLDPMKNRSIGPDELVEKFGVPPEKVTEVQALAGDSVDNVPGVPGIGVKTAAQLITEYGDLESLLARAEEIKQPKRREKLIEHAEDARVSLQLVTLDDNAPVEEDLDEFVRREPDLDVLVPFLREQNFRRLTARFEAAAGGAPATETAPAPAAGNGAYDLVQDEAALAAWVAQAVDQGVVAVDTETTALDSQVAELVGVSLALEAGRACYVPLAHKGTEDQGALDLGGGADAAEAPQQVPMDRAVALLRPMLEDPACLKVGQNIKYDLGIFARHDIAVGPADDTMLMSFVLDGGSHGHGMDELAALHLDHTTIKYSEVAGSGKSQVTFDRVPLDKARDYAAEDADITLRLHQVLKPRLVSEHLCTVYETIERPLIPVIAAMERAGILVDPARLQELSNDFARRIADLEEEVHALAEAPFNIGSPKQLGEVLFDQMGLTGGKKTKTGSYSTNSDVLEPLAEDNEIVAKVLEWRQLSKLRSTYTEALLQQVNPGTGRVHTSYMMAGAQTGRLASTEPNLQNIPVRTEEGRKIREAFVAPKGHKLISLDYSQIELRLVADVAEIDALREAFQDGLDIHAMTASQVFGVPMAEMDAETRRRAKAINFGIIYGISGFGLARQLGCSQGEAKAFIDAYLERFPGIRTYMDEMKKQVKATGFVETLFGRKIHLPGIADRNPARRSYAERQAVNAPIQGSAADIIKRAMIRVPAALEKAQLKAKMLLQVHDELVFEAPEDQVDRTIEIVRAVMEDAPGPSVALSVPLVVDAGVGDNWNQAH